MDIFAFRQAAIIDLAFYRTFRKILFIEPEDVPAFQQYSQKRAELEDTVHFPNPLQRQSIPNPMMGGETKFFQGTCVGSRPVSFVALPTKFWEFLV